MKPSKFLLLCLGVDLLFIGLFSCDVHYRYSFDTTISIFKESWLILTFVYLSTYFISVCLFGCENSCKIMNKSFIKFLIFLGSVLRSFTFGFFSAIYHAG